jgi:hypothetical protein
MDLKSNELSNIFVMTDFYAILAIIINLGHIVLLKLLINDAEKNLFTFFFIPGI